MKNYKYASLDTLSQFVENIKTNYASKNHKHDKSDIADFPNVPSKISELDNDKLYINREDYDNIVDSKFIHISFDDITNCLVNLVNNQYDSLFDEPFFGWLKNLHDMYGAKFSLYVFLDSLINVPDTYKNEFLNSSSWLKIGLHSPNNSENYANATAAIGAEDWNSMVSNVVRITGTTMSVDRMPRLHNFAGSSEAIKAMRDCNCGALGFLAADDNRVSYHFTSSQNNYIISHDLLTSMEDGLVFYRTDVRGDWFLTNGQEPYDYLVNRISDISKADTMRSFIYFVHEYQCYDGTAINSLNKKIIEDVCRFAIDYKIPFDYPQNRILPSLHSAYLDYAKIKNLIVQNTWNGNISNTVTHTTSLADTDDVVYNKCYSFYQLVFANNNGLTGGTTVDSIGGRVGYSGQNGKAADSSNVLVGNFDGATISLSSYTLSTGFQLYWAMWYGYLINDKYNGSQYVRFNGDEDKVFVGQAWVTEGSVTLPTDKSNSQQRVLVFMFKKTEDGMTPFTDDELIELKGLVTFT